MVESKTSNPNQKPQIQRAKAALRQFRKEVGQRKKQIQNGEVSAVQFTNWMIGQEPIIQEICGE